MDEPRVDQVQKGVACSSAKRDLQDATGAAVAAVCACGASRRRLLSGLFGGLVAGALGWPGTEAESKRRDSHRTTRKKTRRKKHGGAHPVAKHATSDGGAAALKLLTRNLYLGADLTPLFGVTTPPQLFTAVQQVFATVQATDFPARAKVLADEIAASDPHIVGLQEATLWRSQTPSDFPSAPNAPDIAYDFLALLLDELTARGKAYAAVATVQNDDAEAPQITPGGLQDIRITDHDVILARTDLPAHVFSVSNAQSDNFSANLTIPNPLLGAITVTRGWTRVDVSLHGQMVRVVNTHLERNHPLIQVAQGNELLAGPLDTSLPTVLLGDLNSAADGIGAVPGQSDTPTYATMLAAGFADAAVTKGERPGFTCCQAADLANATSHLSERVDFVLTRGEIEVSSANRVGDDPNARTPSGLWPSDHAGVWAVLHLTRS